VRIGILLSVREKATRLPGKVIKTIIDKNVTEHLVSRLKMAENVDEIIISTSTNKQDDIFENIALKTSVNIFRGSENDKLLRYLQTADAFDLDAVIVVDGDDLLCFPEYIALTATTLRENKAADVIFTQGLPLGAAASGIKKVALEKVMELKDEDDTEVWGGYFTSCDNFKIDYLQAEGIFRHPEIRMTLDYSEDLLFFESVFNKLYTKNTQFSSYDIMDLLVNKNPELCDITINAQKRYEQHISTATPVRFASDGIGKIYNMS
jgi:spore coat polysaccharide biosynthesis protein SpsF